MFDRWQESRLGERFARWPVVLHGWVRLVGWTALLLLLAAPWRQLGGIVSETLRWWLRASGWGALISGYCVGGLVRDRTERGTPARTRWLRRLLLVPAASLTPALLLLDVLGREALVDLCVLALVAWCGGADVALHVVPRLRALSPLAAEDDLEADLGPHGRHPADLGANRHE